jgi:hypothetical protein
MRSVKFKGCSLLNIFIRSGCGCQCGLNFMEVAEAVVAVHHGCGVLRRWNGWPSGAGTYSLVVDSAVDGLATWQIVVVWRGIVRWKGWRFWGLTGAIPLAHVRVVNPLVTPESFRAIQCFVTWINWSSSLRCCCDAALLL